MKEKMMPRENQRFKEFGEWAAWAITLWIENEEPSYLYWRNRVQELRNGAFEAEHVEEGIWTEEEYVRFTLTEELKSWFEEQADALDLPSGPLSELLEGAISWTPWDVVAMNLLPE